MSDQVRAALESRELCSRVFHPRRSVTCQPFAVDVGDTTLVCRRDELPTSEFFVVYFHGNGETVADLEDDLPQVFASFGCGCFLSEYRGYGMSGGAPTFLNLVEDVPRVIEAAGVPSERIILYGRSIGSLPAIHAASLFPNARGLILEGGIADVGARVRSRWGIDESVIGDEDLAEGMRLHYDHEAKLAAFRGPVIVTHARRDDLVDVSNAEKLFDWARMPKAKLIFSKGGHNSVFFENLGEYAKVFRHLIDGTVPGAFEMKKAPT